MLKPTHINHKKLVNGSVVELALEIPSEPKLAPKEGDPVHNPEIPKSRYKLNLT